jgi:hypothetical protein
VEFEKVWQWVVITQGFITQAVAGTFNGTVNTVQELATAISANATTVWANPVPASNTVAHTVFTLARQGMRRREILAQLNNIYGVNPARKISTTIKKAVAVRVLAGASNGTADPDFAQACGWLVQRHARFTGAGNTAEN